MEDEYSYLEVCFNQFYLEQKDKSYLLSFSEIRTNQIFQLDFSSTSEWRKKYHLEQDNIKDFIIQTTFDTKETILKIIGNNDFRLEISGFLDNRFQKYDLSVKEIQLNLKTYFDAVNLTNRLLNHSKKLNFSTLN